MARGKARQLMVSTATGTASAKASSPPSSSELTTDSLFDRDESTSTISTPASSPGIPAWWWPLQTLQFHQPAQQHQQQQQQQQGFWTSILSEFLHSLAWISNILVWVTILFSPYLLWRLLPTAWHYLKAPSYPIFTTWAVDTTIPIHITNDALLFCPKGHHSNLSINARENMSSHNHILTTLYRRNYDPSSGDIYPMEPPPPSLARPTDIAGYGHIHLSICDGDYLALDTVSIGMRSPFQRNRRCPVHSSYVLTPVLHVPSAPVNRLSIPLMLEKRHELRAGAEIMDALASSPVKGSKRKARGWMAISGLVSGGEGLGCCNGWEDFSCNR